MRILGAWGAGFTAGAISRQCRAKTPEVAAPARAGQATVENPSSPNTDGATSKAPDKRGPTSPLLLLDDEWLSPVPFLPAETSPQPSQDWLRGLLHKGHRTDSCTRGVMSLARSMGRRVVLFGEDRSGLQLPLVQVLLADRWKTSFHSLLRQFEWNVVPLGLQGSSLLMCVMNQALTVGLDFTGCSAGPVLTASATRPPADLPPIHCSVPWASGPLGRSALVYMMMHFFCLQKFTFCPQPIFNSLFPHEDGRIRKNRLSKLHYQFRRYASLIKTF